MDSSLHLEIEKNMEIVAHNDRADRYKTIERSICTALSCIHWGNLIGNADIPAHSSQMSHLIGSYSNPS
ncbi:hypothetical protein NECAME_09591 [Necator americanus]|uniref:Uncharacterized protein n=1 Tax=Necator americanus TaxID=51031 RepID=W2TF90_NECAM|nr:hypothetical protein NECAME_09591 [Necator americanus]ETN79836.1 hypothetical protein NECAME_09591 [Necator americanus]